MRKTQGRRPDETSTTIISLDKDLRSFLRTEVLRNCQSLTIAAWACRILRAKQMTMADLERCLNLGFEY